MAILNWHQERLWKIYSLKSQYLVAGFTSQKRFQNNTKQTNFQKVDPKSNGFAFSSRRADSFYLSFISSNPLLGLVDSEKELVKIFRSYFNRTWINGNVNLSVFYFEKATNNGAESYHECLKSYFKTPHSNIWKFMVTLNSVITDYDLELQRLLEGHEITRGRNSKTQCKTALRNEYKDKYLNNTLHWNSLMQ